MYGKIVKYLIEKQKVNPHLFRDSIWFRVSIGLIRDACRQGYIEIVKDKVIKDEMWQDNWIKYYPDGKDSNDYTIFKLKPKSIKSYYKFQQTSIQL